MKTKPQKLEKILLLSGLQVFPAESGGQMRSAQLAKTLAKRGHSVDIISLTGRKKDYISGAKSEWVTHSPNLKEYIFRGKIFGLIQFLSYRFNLPPLWPWALPKFLLPKVLKQRIHQYDKVILDFPFLFPIAKKLGFPYFLNTHNVEFELWGNGKGFVPGLIRKTEEKALSDALGVFTCSPADQKTLRKLNLNQDTPFYHLPHGIDLDTFAQSSFRGQILRKEIRREYNIDKEKKVLLFCGSKFGPNQEALKFLKSFSETYKEFLLKNNLLILVVGSVSSERYDLPGLKVTSRVEEVLPFFFASDLALNPMAHGSGTNVKMLEYIGAKLPILTTEKGSRGIQFKSGVHGKIFELSHEHFKEAIEDTLRNELHWGLMTEKVFTDNIVELDLNYSLGQTQLF